jgi:hypothetical protein
MPIITVAGKRGSQQGSLPRSGPIGPERGKGTTFQRWATGRPESFSPRTCSHTIG